MALSRAQYLERRRQAATALAINRIVEREAGLITTIYTDAITSGLGKALESGSFGKDLSRKLRNLMTNMENVSRDGRSLAAANKQIAAVARSAALKAFHERVTAGPTYAGQYDTLPGRRLSGHLERALRDPSITTGNALGVGLWHKERLDAAAAHWYRLNYGARSTSGKRPRGGFARSPDDFAINLSGFSRRGFQVLNAGQLPMAEHSKSKGFSVPNLRGRNDPKSAGYGFTKPNIGGQFYFAGPKGRTGSSGKPSLFNTPKPTRGIQGRFFLEAGTSAALDILGEVYGRLPEEWFKKAKSLTR